MTKGRGRDIILCSMGCSHKIIFERNRLFDMDEGGSCYTYNFMTTVELNTVSITCICEKTVPAMLFLLKNRLIS